MTANQIAAGKEAKKVGHINEQRICDLLNIVEAGHIVDGKPNTKQDIINTNTGVAFSLKSVSKNHTQCHLASKKRWIEYFDIDPVIERWFDMFFGVPGFDITDGKSKQHRMTASEIDSRLNAMAVDWFNQNKIAIFDVIVKKGMSDTPVDYLIWYDKPKGLHSVHSVKDLEELVYNGEWVLKETTLHFITADGKKLFHVQMKGSGKKYNSGYHGLMFHIYKCF